MWFAVALAAAPPPIVNGTPTDDYPEVVLLRHTTAGGRVAFVCTGTLVTPTAVLTAAHCLDEVEGYNLTDVRVFSETHPDYSASDDGLEIAADIPMVGVEGEFILAHDGKTGAATCGGDSGGPVFELQGGRATAVAAVHSFGRDDDGTICAGSTSGDTRADLYQDWIGESTGASTDAVVAAEPEGNGKAGRDDVGRIETATCGLALGGRGAGLILLAAVAVLFRRRRASGGPGVQSASICAL